MIEDPELHKLFKAESSEHLERLDDGLLRLEKDVSDQELLEEVFREAHSMKGAARMLGLSRIEAAAHGLESMLNTARKGETELTAELFESMSAALKDLRKLVQEALIAPGSGKAANGTREPSALSSPDAEDRNKPPATPSAPGLPAESGSALPHRETAPPHEQDIREPFHIETVRVETRKLDDLLTLAGELSVIQGRTQHRLSLLDEMQEQWSLLERSRRKFRGMIRATDSTESLLKTNEALRQLLQADGEILAQIGNSIQLARSAFYEDGTRLETTTNMLGERVRAVRLMPLSTIFSLFPRMVRDLAREQDKEVDLLVEGGELNVDKRALEEMKDPLMHLLRNAVDHGIEPPAEREQSGKPRCGTLRLRAERENNNVLLEVSDDGRGMDTGTIRHVALQHKLHDEATLASMTAAQLQQLVFLPGFSTSSYVTELSGRGVGLDVVRVNVERLKGDIRLDSVPQRGTVMQLRLPLSLASTRLLLVSAGGHSFGLPMEFVHTSRRIREEELFTLEGRPAVKLDGQAVIAPRLADLLDLPEPLPSLATEEETGGQTVCIIIQVGGEQIGLRVDELLEEEEVLVKPPGAPLLRVRNVSGLAILGSGEITVVLNPADLLRSTHKLAAAPARNRPTRTAPAAKPRILLAEDSVLVRAMEKRILEDAGYEVVAAVDGAQAFDELGRRPFAAVVSDILMPNMDGLTLTARIRQEQRYRDLPVILVTSLASDADKQRGMEAGANAYIPKPSFDQSMLLDILKRMIVP